MLDLQRTMSPHKINVGRTELPCLQSLPRIRWALKLSHISSIARYILLGIRSCLVNELLLLPMRHVEVVGFGLGLRPLS